jgi:antitoxin component YwqK of YwqJK toxin-antitoxin module
MLTGFVGSLYAQENVEPVNITLHYNLNWELTSPEKSFYKREAYFDLKDMVFDGVYKDFNKDGKLMAEGYYQHGVKAGMQSDYYEDQTIKTSIEYSGNDFTIWQKMTADKKFEIAKGTGKFSINCYYFFDLRVKLGILQGEFLNGKKVGIWIYKDTSGKHTDTEYYEDGKVAKHIVYRKTDSVAVNYRKDVLLSLSSINTQGLAYDKSIFTSVNEYFEKQVAFPESYSRPIAFAGGVKNLLNILSQETSVEKGYLIIAKLKLNEHGKIIKFGLERYADPFTNENIEKLIREYAPYFFPAIQKGKPVASVIYLPVASGEEWAELLRTMPTEYFTDISNFE